MFGMAGDHNRVGLQILGTSRLMAPKAELVTLGEAKTVHPCLSEIQ